jgi:hypothetical protein
MKEKDHSTTDVHENSSDIDQPIHTSPTRMRAILGAQMLALCMLVGMGIDVLAMKTKPGYTSPIVEGLLLLDKLIQHGTHRKDLEGMKHVNYLRTYELPTALPEFKQSDIYIIRSAHELYAALEDIGNKSEQVLKESQFVLHIPGGTTISLGELTPVSLNEPHIESDRTFSSNAAIVLPEGINMLLSGDTEDESRIVFPASEFGIVGVNTRHIQVENLYLERKGESEPNINADERFRSFIYLVSNKEDQVPYSTFFFNVVLDNTVQSPAVVVEQSAITTKHYNAVTVYGLHVYDYYWDGIAAFGAKVLQVTDSLFERTGYRDHEGNAIVLVSSESDTAVVVENVEVSNYLKVFGNFTNERGHLKIIDSDVYNEMFPSYWLFLATGRVDIDGLRMHGFGSEFFSTMPNMGYITINQSSFKLNLHKSLGFKTAEQSIEITRPFIDMHYPDFRFTEVQDTELCIFGDDISTEQIDMLQQLGFTIIK